MTSLRHTTCTLRAQMLGVSLLVAMAALAACDHAADTPKCADVFLPGTRVAPEAIEISLVNRYGRGVANGASVTARVGTRSVDGQVRDTSRVAVYGSDTGSYAVSVSKPFYRDTTISKVVVIARDFCGSILTTNLPVTLELVPGAPPARSLAVLGADFLSAPGAQLHLSAFIDADPGVSTAATWRMSDTTLARIDPVGVVTSKCSVHGGADTVTATSVVDTTVRGTAVFGVGAMASCP